MPPTPPKPIVSASGIVTTGSQRVVPSSVRPDGTIRKEIRIREGYIPQEDIAKYTNRRVEAANYKPQYPVGYVPKEQPKEKKKKPKAEHHEEKEPRSPDPIDTSPVPSAAPQQIPSGSIDPGKRIKALEKKLRQIEQLKERREKGEALLAEQIDKIERMDEIEKELENLKLEK